MTKPPPWKKTMPGSLLTAALDRNDLRDPQTQRRLQLDRLVDRWVRPEGVDVLTPCVATDLVQ